MTVTDWKSNMDVCKMSLNRESTATERFLAVWETLSCTAFCEPQMYYSIFCGKDAADPAAVFARYDQLFPEENRNIQKTNDIKSFSLSLLKTLIPERDNQVKAWNVEMRNDILIACLKQRLQKQCAGDGPSSREAATQMMNTVCGVIGLEQ